MSGAGGPLWNIGGGYGYRPYAAATQGARRLAGLGAPHETALNDPVAAAAKGAAEAIIKDAKAQGPGREMPFVFGVANKLAPGGAAKLDKNMQWLHRLGYNHDNALFQSLSALVANSFAGAILAGKAPAWAMSGLGGFGGIMDDIGGFLKQAACIPGGGAVVGLLAADDKETGAAIGAAGGEALCQVLGGRDKPKQPARQFHPDPAPQQGTPGWVWALAIGGGVFVLGSVLFVGLRRPRAPVNTTALPAIA